jgi:hypothetical protein
MDPYHSLYAVADDTPTPNFTGPSRAAAGTGGCEASLSLVDPLDVDGDQDLFDEMDEWIVGSEEGLYQYLLL